MQYVESSVLKNRICLASLTVAAQLLFCVEALPADTHQIDVNLDVPISSWMAGGGLGLEPASAPSIRDHPSMTIGHFDFPVSIPKTGWYRLEITTKSGWNHTTATMMPRWGGSENQILVGRLQSLEGGKSSWAWLQAGSYILRISSDYWTGLPAVTHLAFRPWEPRMPPPFQIQPQKTGVYRINQCEPLRVLVGGTGSTYAVSARFPLNDGNNRIERFEATKGLTPNSIKVPLACDSAGDFSASLSSDVSGTSQTAGEQSPVKYTVIDTHPTTVRLNSGPLLAQIDVASQEPDYQSCTSNVYRSSAGAYRTSGELGTTPFARRHSAPPNPCWFAYNVSDLKPGEIYKLQFDYPDDADRVMVFAVRDMGMHSYPPSIGAETGGPWPLSQKLQSRSLMFRATATSARVIAINIHDKKSAALSRISLYSVNVAKSERSIENVSDNRRFSLWYEEGGNYRSFSSLDGQADDIYLPVDYYMMLASNSGVTSVTPSVSVYNFALYRAHHEKMFVDGRDDLAAFLLSGERYGISVIAEVNPTASEILWPTRNSDEAKQRLLISADGGYHATDAKGKLLPSPYFNVLDANVSTWMEDLLHDIAEQYSSYPKFEGVQLRISPWHSSGLTNLISLNWGYNASIVTQFFRDTKITAPSNLNLSSDDANSTRERSGFLMNNLKEQWINWRCQKFYAYVSRLIQAIREVKPALTLTLWIDSNDNARGMTVGQLREQGLDLARLASIPGVRIRDAHLRYGAREADLSWRTQWRDAARAPASYNLIPASAGKPQIFNYMQYLEVVGRAVPSVRVGLPDESKSPWFSAAALPPAPFAQERWAYAVAFGDPIEIGDGGNGYVFPSKSERQFLTAYSCLPAQPFALQAGTPSPLVLRRWKNKAYLINLSPHSLSVRLQWPGSHAPTNLCTGTKIPSATAISAYGLLPIELTPGSDGALKIALVK